MSGAEPRQHLFRGAVEQCFFEWRADLAGREPTILLTHATGFHARVWDQTIAHLPDRHVIAVDQRGHGRSEKLRFEHWRDVCEDLAELVRHLGLKDAVGVGHSMGGFATVVAASLAPEGFQRLVLIDPVIAAPGDYATDGWKLPEGFDHPVAKRRNEFDSPDAMIARFRDRRPYSLFRPEVLRDYCVHGLLPAPGGEGFVLACPPEIEASVYMTSRSYPQVHDAVRAVDVPVVVLRAFHPEKREGVMDFEASPTWPGLAGEFPNGTDVYLPELTHFIPMQEPALTAEYVLGTRP